MLETSCFHGSVLSDGRTCWVNLHGVCMARFGQQGFQVGDQWNPAREPGDQDWKQFCVDVHQAYHLLVVEYHRPTWVGGAYQDVLAAQPVGHEWLEAGP